MCHDNIHSLFCKVYNHFRSFRNRLFLLLNIFT